MSFRFFAGVVLLLGCVVPAFAQLLDEKPISVGGNPVGTWEADQDPVRVYADPALVAAVSNLQFSGTTSGRLVLDGQGGYEIDYITQSSVSLSVVIFGQDVPFSFDIADTNRSQGTYTVSGSQLFFAPTTAGVEPDTVAFSVNGNTLQLIQEVPFGALESTVASIAPNAELPLAVLTLQKVSVGELTADFNGDKAVDFTDFIAFVQHFGTRTGDANFDAIYDLNGNGAVDFTDFLTFSAQFGLKQ